MKKTEDCSHRTQYNPIHKVSSKSWPNPIQSNPIQSNPWMDPIHVQLWATSPVCITSHLHAHAAQLYINTGELSQPVLPDLYFPLFDSFAYKSRRNINPDWSCIASLIW